MARQAEGMSISRAVSHWKQLVNENRDPLASVTPEPEAVPTNATITRMREMWVSACIGFNEPHAENAFNQAFAMYPQETVCDAVIREGLVEIGDLWYTGKVSVQQEHFASTLAMRRIQNLIAAAPPPTRSGQIVIGCPAGEMHEFTALLFLLFLRRRGWPTSYLGANIPHDKMESALKILKPGLLIMVAQHLPSAAALRESAQQARDMDIPFAFAGQVFLTYPNLMNHIPGHFLGKRLSLGVEYIEQLLKYPIPEITDTPIPKRYKLALQKFKETRIQINAQIWLEFEADKDILPYLDDINRRFSEHIIAALQLGDVYLLATSIDWVTNLLKNKHIPTALLVQYLHVYHNAIQKWMGKHSDILSHWFSETLETNGNN